MAIRKAILLVLGWLSLCLLAPAVSAQQNAGPEYRLDPGDIVRITVYNNPDLTT